MEALAQLRLERAPAKRAARAFRALGSPSVVLFLALFTSQAGVLVLSPILADVARDLDVSLSTAGQLRILAAPLAAVVAVAVARSLGRVTARALLSVGVVLLGVGSLASAAAPTFVTLALAQVPVWAGVAILVSAGISAAGSWAEPAERPRVIARALAGGPAAWIVGMPLIGLAGESSWRLAFLVLPVPAALLAGLSLAARAPDRPSGKPSKPPLGALLRRPDARRWAIGELAANSAWAGTLVFSGALFTEAYGTTSLVTGLALALVALAYLVGNVWGGRLDAAHARRSMLETSVAAALAVGLVWAVTPGPLTTLALFSLAAFVAASRTIAGTVYGFEISREHGAAVGSIRSATTQIGYLLGSLVGGAALAVGGFDALGLAYGGMFLAAVVPYVSLRSSRGLRTGPCVAEA